LLIFTRIAPLRAYLSVQNHLQKSIGLVPTMGALHRGHVSLIAQSKAQTNITVASIFVNPTQFTNQEDLLKYPRTIEADILMLKKSGCDVLFYPLASEIYPNGMESKNYQWGSITNSIEGFFRPGHFNGVVTVVKRLFEIIQPHKAFFGKKDYQQCAVIKELVINFHMPIKIVLSETLREHSGLAMSSRNTRLSENEKTQAVAISQMLFWMRSHWRNFALPDLLHQARSLLTQSPALSVEYLNIVDSEKFDEVAVFQKEKGQYVVLIACWCGNVRLIDNIELS